MRLEHLVWEGAGTPTEAALHARLAADGFDVYRWTDAPGAHYEPHTHDEDETLWVLAGEITFEIAGRAYRLGPGDRLRLPAGTVHAATAGTGGATYLIGELTRR